jgi:1,4-dihydroxy-2-naphthoyl-CoA hydrolase
MNLYNTVQDLNNSVEGTLMESLQIRFLDFTHEILTAEMPVNKSTIQPYGFLHGGATMALAESVGGALSLLSLEDKTLIAVGVEINANHLLPVLNGNVKATASFLRKGNSIHVIDIRVTDISGRLVSVCRLTNKIVKKEEL